LLKETAIMSLQHHWQQLKYSAQFIMTMLNIVRQKLNRADALLRMVMELYLYLLVDCSLAQILYLILMVSLLVKQMMQPVQLQFVDEY
jgi:hypothetical protein